MAGGRPPEDVPSPNSSTNPFVIRCRITSATVGAVRPDMRTRSALEQGLCVRKRRSNSRLFETRNCAGRAACAGALTGTARAVMGRLVVRRRCAVACLVMSVSGHYKVILESANRSSRHKGLPCRSKIHNRQNRPAGPPRSRLTISVPGCSRSHAATVLASRSGSRSTPCASSGRTGRVVAMPLAPCPVVDPERRNGLCGVRFRMHSQVEISGVGIAAACCARVLTASATPCARIATPYPRRGMAILLSASSAGLLSDLFPATPLFASCHVTERRHVLWGTGASVTVLPHAGFVASEQWLLPKLWAALDIHEGEAAAGAWQILTQSSASQLQQVSAFGSQMATGCGVATLISVGDSPQSLLANSRLVGAKIARLSATSKPVPCAPRMLAHLAGERWLACGTAAMTFDPVCGEGAGYAVREGILSAATVRAALRGEDARMLCRYYEARLRLGFLRHLQMCHRFYSTGGGGEFWRSAVEDLQHGMRTLAKGTNVADASLYRLDDFDLISVSATASR